MMFFLGLSVGLLLGFLGLYTLIFVATRSKAYQDFKRDLSTETFSKEPGDIVETSDFDFSEKLKEPGDKTIDELVV